jgi:hypothetical protein
MKTDLSKQITQFLKSQYGDKDYLIISVRQTDYGYLVIFNVILKQTDGLWASISKQINTTIVIKQLCSVFNLQKNQLSVHNMMKPHYSNYLS